MPKSQSRRRSLPKPTERAWLQVVGLALIVAKVTLVSAVFDPLAAQAFALPKSALSRALLYPLVLVLASYLAMHPGRRPQGRLVWAIGAYGAAAALSTALAVHPPTALYGALGRYLGLTSILDGLVLAVAIMTFVRSAREVALVVGGMLGGASAALAYALLQLAGLDPVKWTEAQIASTMGNSGALAGLLVCAAVVAGAILALQWTSLRWSARLALGLIAAAGTAMVLSIGTRSATLALPIALVAVAAAWWRARPTSLSLPAVRRPGVAVGAAVISALVLVVVSSVVARSPAAARVLALAQGGDLSSGERGFIYRAAFDAFLPRPLLGVGPDSFIAVYPSVRPVEIAVFSADWMQSSTHSWFLHHLLGTGTIGLGALLVVAGLALRSSLRRPGELAPTVGGIGILIFLAQGVFTINHVGTEWLFWAFVGLAGVRAAPAADHAGDRERATRSALPVRRDHLFAVAAVALGLALASTTVASVDASHKVLLSDRARARGDLRSAVLWAERAVAADSGRAENWNVLGLAYAKEPERAAAAFRRAHEAAPFDPTYLLNLSQAEAALSDKSGAWKDAALQHARQAAEADPNNAGTQKSVARLVWSLGDLDGAIARIERAIRISARPADHLLLAADIYESAGRRAEAIDRLEGHVAASWPDGNVPLEVRRRLGRLYHAVGDRGKLDRLVPPPRVADVTRCSPTCLVVRFDTSEDLRTDDSRGSALSLDNYSLRGVALPAGTRADFQAPSSVTLTMPGGITPVVAGDAVQVASVEDAYGRAIVPSPTVLLVR